MGEVDITGDRTISEQPYAGVLSKSQNASTWTADQHEDLKFSINRAEFVTNQNSSVILNNVALDKGNKGVIQLRNDAVETLFQNCSWCLILQLFRLLSVQESNRRLLLQKQRSLMFKT